MISESPTLRAHGTSKDGGAEGGEGRGEREREREREREGEGETGGSDRNGTGWTESE